MIVFYSSLFQRCTIHRQVYIPTYGGSSGLVVKIQSGKEYGHYNPRKVIMLHDKTLDLHIVFSNPQLYHLIHECGVLETERFTIKAIQYRSVLFEDLPCIVRR
jgi:hypothetical protein